VSKDGRVRRCTISPKILCDYCSDGHGNANEAVLVNPGPDDVEPGQSTPRCSPATPLSTTAFFKPSHWPDPSLWLKAPEVILLVVEIRRDIVTEEREEGGNRKRFVAFVDDIEVDCVPVEPEGEERGCCVDRNHKEDANDARTCQHNPVKRRNSTYCLCSYGFV
jgi:hypothetical protein